MINCQTLLWPLVFNKYIEGDDLNILLIADLSKDEYSEIMDDIIKQQNIECARTRSVPSPKANTINYIAALLGEVERAQKSNALTKVLTSDKNQLISVYPNPAGNIVNIELAGFKPTGVVIKICDLSGKVLKSVSKNMIGDYTFSINIQDIAIGTYICKIEAENVVRTTQINVIK